MMELAWLIRQLLVFVAYGYLYLILVLAMTALFFGLQLGGDND